MKDGVLLKMGKLHKRFAGDELNLNHDLFPAPTETKFVRAFFFDVDGNALSPASVDMVDKGGGRFIDTTILMQNVPMMKVRFQVYTDSGYTELDCEYPGDTDCYELDSLLPTQLPSAESITANIEPAAEVQASMEDVSLDVQIGSDEIKASISSEEELQADQATDDVAASLDSDEIKANIE